MRWIAAFPLLIVLVFAKNREPGDFDWDSIPPSKTLHFTVCYEDLQCARLLTPLDWFNNRTESSAELFVTLALIKKPAIVPPSHHTYGGAIITNPGGPGDSGILSILTNGEYIQNMVDSDEKHFDVWSFDPRGMGFSVPTADCFPNEVARALVDAQSEGQGSVNKHSNADLAMRKATEAALSLQCAAHTLNKDGYSIQEYMSTAYIARDMLHMVDKLDESMKASCGYPSNSQIPLTKESEQPSLPRLQYYGTSYGTYLGQTFLAMFPGRVRRMALDGVVTPEDYTIGRWCTALEDTTKVFDYFYQACFDAGEKCPLRSSSDRSWKEIKNKIENMIVQLNENPQPIITKNSSPIVISGATIRETMVDPMYVPLLFHERVASILASAVQGNYTALVRTDGDTDPSRACEAHKHSEYRWMDQASLASRCADGDDLRDRGPQYWKKYISECENMSPEMGLAWTAGCSGWTIRPRYRFTGPFRSPKANESEIEGHPSAPVLFLSSHIDPVTPLSAARKAAKAHPGAGIVVQNSVGHCAMLSSPSRCTNEKLSAYMARGVVPDGEEKCEADCTPWKTCPYPVARLPR